jgi:hypothetical protein
MVAIWVITVRVLAGIEKQAYHVRVAVLGGEGQGAMSALAVGAWEQARGFRKPAQAGYHNQVIQGRAAAGERLRGIQVAEFQGRQDGRLPLRARPIEGGAVIQ